MKKNISLITMVLLLALSSYVYADEYIPVENIATLQVSFVDPVWDGKTVPEGQQCQAFGGKGSSPALLVKNIPAGANAIIVSFSDRTFKQNDLGGHGIIGIWIFDNATSVIIPSILGETNEMPKGMFIESKFRSTRGKEGAYLPPCSGGRGNEYYATVRAVYKATSDTEESKLLGEANIEMGIY